MLPVYPDRHAQHRIDVRHVSLDFQSLKSPLESFYYFHKKSRPVEQHSRMIHVTCAIIIDESKVLVTQRSETMKLPLKWEFPGGKINPKETAEVCIKRELMEELNVEVEILERLSDSEYDYPTFTINLIPFVARLKAGELLLREHKAFQWLSPGELKSVDWAPADISVVEKFLKSNYASRRTI